MGNTVPIRLFFIILLSLAVLVYFLNLDGFMGNYNMALPFEGFSSIMDDYAKNQEAKHSPLNTLLMESERVGLLGSTGNPIMGTHGDSTTYPLQEQETGLFKIKTMCEKVKTNTNGSVFDNPEFAENCGLCLGIGKDSRGNPTEGGLALVEVDRNNARRAVLGKAIPNYKASAGTCPANRLVSTKAEWMRLTKQIECEKSGSYDIDECSQCYDNQSYTMVPTDPARGGVSTGTGVIHVVGSGNFSYSEQGFGSGSTTLSSTPYRIQLQGPETTRVTMDIKGTATNPASLSGYLSGETQTGTFTMDLYRLVLIDRETGRKPRTGKIITVGGISVSTMSAGFGKQAMKLELNMPFTFVDKTSEEASQCPSSPFITKKASAEFLGTDPCYEKGSGPGNFSLKCLQASFEANGCTNKGTGYPRNAVTAAALMASSGQFRSLSDIAGYIYDQAVSASTGRSSSGNKLSIQDWSSASEFCTGNVLTSPCDADTNSERGPLSNECLSFLWTNGGDSSNTAYNRFSSATSLSADGARTQYCQLSGSLSPLDTTGRENEKNLNYWRGKGGLDSVKSLLKEIHTKANDNTLADDIRLPYLTQCYGILSLPKTPGRPAEDLPKSYVCVRAQIIGKVRTRKNFILSFDLIPTAAPINTWASIVHFTTGNDCCDLGSRAPAIWFAPNTLNEFAVHVGHSTDGSWACRPKLPSSSPDFIQVGKQTRFTLTCDQNNITVKIGSTVFNYTMEGDRYEGLVTVYGGDTWYPSAGASVNNFSYVLSP